MSTKKIILMIAGIVAVLALIVALFVGAIAWFTFHTIANSEAAEAARTFLRSNEILKQDIGEVKDFGSIITGNISTQNADGEATLYLKVIGEKRNVNVRVDLSYRNNRSWRVTGASYERDGNTIDLVQGYGPSPTPTPPAN
jgi:Na+-translocating ferredoxin:NAD+ oxidoreductase RnfG subunit